MKDANVLSNQRSVCKQGAYISSIGMRATLEIQAELSHMPGNKYRE